MAERIKARDLIDLPEKVAIAVGFGLIALSGFAPALFPTGAELVVGGGVSLGITRATLPRKE